jgi:hypothetical protein
MTKGRVKLTSAAATEGWTAQQQVIRRLPPVGGSGGREWHISSHYPTQAKGRLEWGTRHLRAGQAHSEKRARCGPPFLRERTRAPRQKHWARFGSRANERQQKLVTSAVGAIASCCPRGEPCWWIRWWRCGASDPAKRGFR